MPAAIGEQNGRRRLRLQLEYFGEHPLPDAAYCWRPPGKAANPVDKASSDQLV
jgi:hypothetical protein